MIGYGPRYIQIRDEGGCGWRGFKRCLMPLTWMVMRIEVLCSIDKNCKMPLSSRGKSSQMLHSDTSSTCTTKIKQTESSISSPSILAEKKQSILRLQDHYYKSRLQQYGYDPHCARYCTCRKRMCAKVSRWWTGRTSTHLTMWKILARPHMSW